MTADAADKPYDSRSFGKNLRIARLLKGHTQESLADGTGLTRDTIQKLENGRRRPHLDTFVDLVEYLGVDPVELIKREDAPLMPPSADIGPTQRSLVLEFVQSHPGTSYTQIAEFLEMERKQVLAVISYLRRRGDVKFGDPIYAKESK